MKLIVRDNVSRREDISLGRLRLMVNILIVDSNLIYRKGLISILGDYPEFRVVGEATDSREAAAKADEVQPDIVIVDIFACGGEGIEAITFLRQKFPDAKVIILTASEKEKDFFEAIKSGARGYLSKSVALTELIESIRLVASGDAIVSPSKAIRLLEEFRETNEVSRNGGNRLTPREIEVLQLVAQGASNKEIAASCYVSETTVKAHLRKILEKLRVKNRAEAVALAANKGLFNRS